MIGKKNIARLYGACLATMYATLVTGIVYGAWRPAHVIVVLIIFVALWIGFYFTGIWTALDRPAELHKRIPVSSNELRKKKRLFTIGWLRKGDGRIAA